jgi:hypothetical protein
MKSIWSKYYNIMKNTNPFTTLPKAASPFPLTFPTTNGKVKTISNRPLSQDFLLNKDNLVKRKFDSLELDSQKSQQTSSNLFSQKENSQVDKKFKIESSLDEVNSLISQYSENSAATLVNETKSQYFSSESFDSGSTDMSMSPLIIRVCVS